jgi:hypothetical protein
LDCARLGSDRVGVSCHLIKGIGDGSDLGLGLAGSVRMECKRGGRCVVEMDVLTSSLAQRGH